MTARHKLNAAYAAGSLAVAALIGGAAALEFHPGEQLAHDEVVNVDAVFGDVESLNQ
jgi:hypothetical protein